MKSEIVTHLGRSDVFKAYQKAFQATTGLPLALRGVGCLQSPLQSSSYGSAFCTLMAKCNKSCATCLELQQRMEEGAVERTCTIECFAGLNESAVPIRVGEKVVAYLQTGQVLFRRPSAARYRRILTQFGEWESTIDATELRKAYFGTRVVARSQYESILRLLGIFAQHLSTVSNQLALQGASAEPPAVVKARTYIEEHRDEELSLAQVARAVNMSVFHFCKTFRKATGLTFVDYLARVRIERIKNLLNDPYKRVSEAAFEAGFQSLSQFNRVFRRIAGEAPSTYRNRVLVRAA
jgi:AraC-like DNA-binding protein/ligand-binding sensor protein